MEQPETIEAEKRASGSLERVVRQHEWQRGETLQWGERGLMPSAAATEWACKTCGAHFTHRYNIQPNIYQAMADAGIGEECKGHAV